MLPGHNPLSEEKRTDWQGAQSLELGILDSSSDANTSGAAHLTMLGILLCTAGAEVPPSQASAEGPK